MEVIPAIVTGVKVVGQASSFYQKAPPVAKVGLNIVNTIFSPVTWICIIIMTIILGIIFAVLINRYQPCWLRNVMGIPADLDNGCDGKVRVSTWRLLWVSFLSAFVISFLICMIIGFIASYAISEGFTKIASAFK